MDVATDAAAAYASAGYVVVWDGIVGPWFLDGVARRLGARGIGLSGCPTPISEVPGCLG
ncbi:MAG: hypothetical protein GY773_11740 [Actinomycetia bacterium]|nr:hypothetical protein [Actinomycetes bacterium]